MVSKRVVTVRNAAMGDKGGGDLQGAWKTGCSQVHEAFLFPRVQLDFLNTFLKRRGSCHMGLI